MTYSPTTLCPRDWHFAIRACWLCGATSEDRAAGAVGNAGGGQVPMEIAAAFRVGSIAAVLRLVRDHPDDYLRLAIRLKARHAAGDPVGA